MITCDLCGREYESYHQLGWHVYERHLIESDGKAWNTDIATCWCGRRCYLHCWYPDAAPLLKHNDFSFHLFKHGGLAGHLLELSLLSEFKCKVRNVTKQPC